MFGSTWLNLGSIILGLIAWLLPIITLLKYDKVSNYKCIVFISLTACAASLCLVIYYINHLVKIEDWTALMDTVPSFVLVSTILLIITIVLNGLLLVKGFRKKLTD